MGDALEFAKMSGAGNDFILGDDRDGAWSAYDLPGLARGLCRRALSVGADGLLLIQPSERAAYRLTILNSDGSGSPMCGNGARCAARFASAMGLITDGGRFEAGGRLLEAQLLEDGQVRVELPGRAQAPLPVRIELADGPCEGFLAHTGVPHFVTFVRDLAAVPVRRLGRALRTASEFGPDGANVDFVQEDPAGDFALRTYERGVEGETLACGTGAAAVAWVLHRLGRAGRNVDLKTASGKSLRVEIDEASPTGNPFRLCGEARFVCSGTIPPESIEEALKCSAAG